MSSKVKAFRIGHFVNNEILKSRINDIMYIDGYTLRTSALQYNVHNLLCDIVVMSSFQFCDCIKNGLGVKIILHVLEILFTAE